MTEYHPTVQKITDLLDQHHVSYTYFEHAAVRTSEEAAALRPEYDLSQGLKALIVRVSPRGGEKYFAQMVVPGNVRFDTKKVKALLAAKDIRFASEEEVGKITDGVKPGGVPPFGNLFKLPVYVEETCAQHEEVIFNAGDKRFSIAMKWSDYLTVVKPIVADIIA